MNTEEPIETAKGTHYFQFKEQWRVSWEIASPWSGEWSSQEVVQSKHDAQSQYDGLMSLVAAGEQIRNVRIDLAADPSQVEEWLDGKLRQAKAEALREAAGELEYGNPITGWLAERADQLEAGQMPADSSSQLDALRLYAALRAGLDACNLVISNADGHKPPGPPHPSREQAVAVRISAAINEVLGEP